MTPLRDDPIDVTLVVPCYNEEAILSRTIPPLLAALEAEVPRCELLLVDNGSTDGTAREIEALCASSPRLRATTVATNTGYGRGVLAGYAAARGRCIGHIPADGPVSPEEVARLARHALDGGAGYLISAVRLGRQETLVRKIVSRGYNLLFFLIFGSLSPDINGTPKFLHRVDYNRLAPTSTDYFLEAEMMLGAARHGIEVQQLEVRSMARPGGASKVSARLLRAIAEFVANMLRFRVAMWAPLPPTESDPLAKVEE